MAKPVQYQYNTSDRSKKTTEYKRFSEEYFAGQDVRIYFGDTWVDEIVSMQFAVLTNVAPIHGYASYTYDQVAVGSRQVQGSFRINFKESYYLHFITNRLESELETMYSNAQYNSSNPKTKKATDIVSPEHVLAVSTSNTEKFEKLAYEYEEALWGVSSNSGMTAKVQNGGNYDYFAPENSRPNLAKHGFTITSLYGPYAQSYKPGAKTESVASTALTLTGVYLTGVSHVVDGSGQPIQEEYTFIAKDLNGPANMV